MLIDSHCHLNYKGLVEDQAAVLERARAAGVGVMLNISTRENEWDAVLATAERNADIWATVGIHPHEADAHPEVDTAKLKARAGHRSEEHTSELQSLMRNSYAVFCLKNK